MVRPTRLATQPRRIRKQTYLTDDEAVRFEEIAAQTGLTESEFLRKTALAQPIRPKRSRQSESLVRELNKLGADLNRVGNNINQLAKKANTQGTLTDDWGLEADLQALREAVALIVETIKKV